MPSRELTGLGLRAFYDVGEDGWGVAMSEDLRKLSFLTQIAVDSIAASLPGSPANGASVLLTATAEAGNIALYDVATWIYFEPNEGWRLFDRATNNVHTYDGTAWVLEVGLPTLGTAGQVLAVNTDADGTEWVSRVDLPTLGTAGQVLAVNTDADGTEWVDPASVGEGNTIEVVSGTAYTTVLADFDGGKVKRMNNAAAQTVTVAPDLVGTDTCFFYQQGVGSVTFAAGAGVTLRSLGDDLTISGRYGSAALIWVATNEYLIVGALA